MSNRTTGRKVVAAALLAAGLVPVTAADARPLKKEQCDALAQERAKLATSGVERAIVKGPSWTQQNMAVGIVGKVRRYIEVEEQLRFRCTGKKPPEWPPEASAAATAEKPSEPIVKKPAERKKSAATTAGEKAKASPPAVIRAAVAVPTLVSLPGTKTPAGQSDVATTGDADNLQAPAKEDLEPMQASLGAALVPDPDRKPARATKIKRRRKARKAPPVVKGPAFRLPEIAGN